ncbi:hypothetical protein Hanom_Chr02g00138621 [Helianthus anomalus]
MASCDAAGEGYRLSPEGRPDHTYCLQISSSCNFRLPITNFCKSMFDEYAVHISQMHPLSLAKLRHFEYACLSLGFL